MNHKILEQTKGGGFLAGDLPMSTSSIHICGICTSHRPAVAYVLHIGHLAYGEKTF